jgi:hypothetical protein
MGYLVKNSSLPTRSKCDVEIYTNYLLVEPNGSSCVKLSNSLDEVSHDSINRFLVRSDLSPKNLFDEVFKSIDPAGGVLTVDDTVLDKEFSIPSKADLVGFFYSGRHHDVVKGVDLVTLFYTDKNDRCVPLDYRIVDPKSTKTKHDLFREMVKEVLSWGLKPKIVTGDSWYASLDNFKFIRDLDLGFLFGIESNRTFSIEKGTYSQVKELNIPDNGLMAHLRGFGFIKVFKTVFKEENVRYWVLFSLEDLESIDKKRFDQVHEVHWNIEQFHRAIKQLCNAENFFVRAAKAVINHIFCVLRAFVKLELMRIRGIIKNWYEFKSTMLREFMRDAMRMCA